MWNDVQLYIAFYSPSIALRLFGELVLPGGGDKYELTKKDGAYVLRSRYITEWEKARIREHSDMELRTRLSCSVLRPGEVDVTDTINRMIDHIYCEITHDFLLLENGKDTIALRKDWMTLVNTNVKKSFGSEVCDRQYEIRHLPKFNLEENNPNGNSMDNRH
ncbi:MAG: hypothetical protein F4X02_11800 [Chloroflexi bacterium]|nr:hypothetical protein [Chloroflexota bacterium]